MNVNEVILPLPISNRPACYFLSLLFILGQTQLVSAQSGGAPASTEAAPNLEGFEKGIGFRNAENTLNINMRFRLQNRADFLFDQSSALSRGNLTTEWQTRRARLRFTGFVADPRLRFNLQLSFSRRDMDWDESSVPNILRDAMVFYDVNQNWQLSFGQGKLPGNRERLVSSGELQFIDRSSLNSRFNIDRDFGFQTQTIINIKDQLVLLKGALTSGEGRNRNVRNSNQPAMVARVEYLPFGKFDNNGDFSESDLAFEQSAKLSLAASAAILTGTPRANGTVGEIFTSTGANGAPLARRTQNVQFIDLMFKRRGLSVLAEWAHRSTENPILNLDQAVLVGQGWNLQIGAMLTDKVELAFRHSLVLPEAEVANYHSRLQDWAMVSNYFYSGHKVKFQTEVGIQEARQVYTRFQVELGI